MHFKWKNLIAFVVGNVRFATKDIARDKKRIVEALEPVIKFQFFLFSLIQCNQVGIKAAGINFHWIRMKSCFSQEFGPFWRKNGEIEKEGMGTKKCCLYQPIVSSVMFFARSFYVLTYKRTLRLTLPILISGQ